MSQSKPKGITIVATLSVVIFLLGLLGVLLINASKLNDHIKDNLQLTVFFDTDLSEWEAKRLSDSIVLLPFASSGAFVSCEEAVFLFKNEIGEDFVDVLGDNPLPASLEISLKRKFSDEASLARLERELGASKGVLEVSYPQNVFQQIDRNLRIISFWLPALSIMLIIVAIVLMSNTIKILIYSDRFIIKNQQLIGATQNFILNPYKKMSLKWTIYSFCVGTALLASTIWLIFNLLSVSMDLNLRAIGLHFAQNWYQYILMLFLLLVGVAAVIYIATHLATKKYLNTHSDNLYN
jgi:cell division transport system permease protein